MFTTASKNFHSRIHRFISQGESPKRNRGVNLMRAIQNDIQRLFFPFNRRVHHIITYYLFIYGLRSTPSPLHERINCVLANIEQLDLERLNQVE
jgi:hypothetical protein